MQSNPLELVAAALGVISVALVIRRNIAAFPIGIAMSAIFTFLFFQKQFYAQAGLQVVFIGLQAWGWTKWKKTGAGKRIDVRDSMSGRDWLLTLLALAASIAGIGLLLRHTTDGKLPFLDATTTALLLAAQFWMNQQQLRHWFFWMLADLLLVVQMAFGGLYWTMLLEVVLFLQAGIGFVVWWRGKRKEG